MTKLGFIGFGLIGGSIAKALKKNNSYNITVYTRRQNPQLEKGVKEGIIDKICYEINSDFADMDVIFLCAPVLKNSDYLPVLKKIIKSDCIITDVGSAKHTICEDAIKHGLGKNFIGGHPMAGSEKTGYESATDTLLENAYYLITPTKNTPKEKIKILKGLIEQTGANPVILSPKKHDSITAAISHVPHIIAVSLVNLVKNNDDKEQNMKAFAAGGFKDITRIASSSPSMWQDICVANKESISGYLNDFISMLTIFKESVENEESTFVYNSFETAGEYRNSIPNKKSSIIAQSFDLYVNIDDKAGAIATIATILSNKNINIKNIGIINNREFEDGVLRIELESDNDKNTALSILNSNGYSVITRE